MQVGHAFPLGESDSFLVWAEPQFAHVCFNERLSPLFKTLQMLHVHDNDSSLPETLFWFSEGGVKEKLILGDDLIN